MTHVITKICKVCGEPKPLTVFPQMPGAKGGIIYGDICADCRKAKLEQLKQNEHEDSTRSSSGYKIDAKAKVADDASKADIQQQVELQYHEERDANEQQKLAKDEKTQQTAQNERDHRERLKEQSASREASQKARFKEFLGPDSFLVRQAERAAIQNARVQNTNKVLITSKRLTESNNKALNISKKLAESKSQSVLSSERKISQQVSSSERKIESSSNSSGMFQDAPKQTLPKTQSTEVKPQQTQTSQVKPPERKMSNLFSGLLNKQPETKPKTDPIEYAKQNTPPPSPTTKRGPK